MILLFFVFATLHNLISPIVFSLHAVRVLAHKMNGCSNVFVLLPSGAEGCFQQIIAEPSGFSFILGKAPSPLVSIVFSGGRGGGGQLSILLFSLSSSGQTSLKLSQWIYRKDPESCGSLSATPRNKTLRPWQRECTLKTRSTKTASRQHTKLTQEFKFGSRGTNFFFWCCQKKEKKNCIKKDKKSESA